MADNGFHQIGTGLVVFDHADIVEGRVVWLDSPQAVLEFVQREDPSEWIVLARGGTTTFLTPALSSGVKGVMTLQGAPESHLGILSREYGIPCLMSVAFAEGVRSERGETIPPDGAVVRLDFSTSPGTVAIEDGAPGVAAAPTEEDPAAAEQAAQLAALMAAYRGEIASGNDGHRQMRARMVTSVIETSDASVRRDLEPDEITDFLSYCGWNLWDLIAARSTEGESGLIPRQEYETVSFVQQWATYGELYRRVTDAIGMDGVIDLGATARREIGTKLNHVHHWTAMCPLLGRGIVTTMGLEDASARPEDLQSIIGFMRRLQHGTWGGGPGFVSGRGYVAPVLDDGWLERFRDQERRLNDPDELAAFRKFNAATELCGFLLHYDCRAGLCDTGPYPLADGGFVLVRDHFLHDPTYEWADVVSDLPYCVTQAMFFRPDGPQEISINDIATTFARPANYLKHLSGAVVYARDTMDTPMSKIRVLDRAEMDRIVDRCNEAMLSLYATIGALSHDEKIRNGVKVYTRDMMAPYARPAGLWEQFLADGFDELTDLAEAAYPALVGGEAAPVLGGVFLMGVGLVPEAGLRPAPEVGPDAFPALHAVTLRGNLAEVPGDAELLVAAGLLRSTPAGYMLTDIGRQRHAQLFETERQGVDLDALATVYERFLAVNTDFKQSLAAPSADAALLAADLAELIERAGPALRRAGEQVPRFREYADRLADALAKADAGDEAFLASPSVDSVHTVWMEMHEDFLQLLGRSRELEGSY
jgi:hypothetical protein